jgi:peptide/nickel transport system ATP-binding protein
MSGDAAPLLEAQGIVKEFGVRRSPVETLRRASIAGHRAVDEVSLTLRRGEILGLAGGSGSGKTTLARCLTASSRPTPGRSTSTASTYARRAGAGYASCGGGCRWSSRTRTPR